MLTLDEAIAHCEEVAEENEKKLKSWGRHCLATIEEQTCLDCASEHRQLAEWLRELKRDREILNGLSIYFQSLVVDAVINQRPLIFDMRDAPTIIEGSDSE